ncbi:MAG: response regulator, partial [Lachnospiraceae bacterium]|nr:response regulator [Lachnospiraceae bacterium]
GYLCQMLSRSMREAILCQQISYLGRTWVPLALALFVASYCGREAITRLYIMGPLFLLHLAVYILVLTSDYQQLYYINRSFSEEGLFPHLVYDYGIMHVVYNFMLIAYAVYTYVEMGRKLKNTKDPVTRKGGIFVTAGLVTLTLFFVAELLDLGREYDMIQLGYVFSAVFFYIALIRYDILDTRKLTRDLVIDRLSEPIVAVDERGMIAYFNKPALRLFPDLANKENSVAEQLEAITGKDEIIEFDSRKLQPRKTSLMRSGGVAGYAYIFSDETERISYTERLEKEKSRADLANKAKSDFLARMSHDIRTPINAILGMDEMILRECKEPETVNFANDIRKAGNTLLLIVNDILDLSKIEEGKMEIVPADYELASLIGDVSLLIRERAEEKKLKFEITVNENIPHLLHGDDIRIKQCVINLLTNAVKYTNEGSIRLSVDYIEKEHGKIDLKIKVSDTGIGMKPEDLKHLYDPYTRFDEEKNRGVEGTGLGMDIVGKLLGLMGGKLNVDSEYGKGSVFSFSLEQDVVEETPVGNISARLVKYYGDQNEYHELFHAPTARILVVDDNEVNLTVIRNLLKKTDITVDTALSGPEAVNAFKNTDYDGVFIDHMMPGMDGMETLAEIKKIEKSAGIPCIALTANAIAGAREMYLSAGFAGYLSKPVEASLLEKTLIEILPPSKVVITKEVAKQAEPAPAHEHPYKAEPRPAKAPERPVHKPVMLYIDGVDIDRGIQICGSKKVYEGVLKVFSRTADKYADEIQEFFDAEDWENYVIKVHALKSSARTIGANELSERAARLERAGKTDAITYIRENTEDVISDYRLLAKQIEACLPEEG